MNSSHLPHLDSTFHLSVNNIGGIDHTEIKLESGVNILSGKNATNRTSFLQALMAVTGSDNVSLKGDADQGTVKLKQDGETLTRTLSRVQGTVQFDGNPIVDDSTIVDLFAFLLEDNEARQAVANGADLREIIMQPVDTQKINAEIEQLESEKRELDEKIQNIENQKANLPELEKRKSKIQNKIEDKESRLDVKRAELEEADKDVSEASEQESELEEVMSDLQAARSELDDVEFKLETEQQSLEEVQEERAEVEDTLEKFEQDVVEDSKDLESEIDRLRDHKHSLDSTVTQLQRVIQFNEEMLEGPDTDIRGALTPDNRTESTTEQLIAETTVCWTCGSEVKPESVDETIDELRELRREKATERSSISDEIENLKSRMREIETQERKRTEAEQRYQTLESQIANRKSAIESLNQKRSEIQNGISNLESRAEELEAEEQSEVLSLHREINELEFELGQLQDEFEANEERIEDIENQLGRQEDIKTERKEVSQELIELRTRIETLENESVEQFNEHMDTILEILQYENLDRVWLERTEKTVREGRKKVERGSFDLHVVRSTDDGRTYEDTVDHLSESEREVTGLVFALAGYLLHDVYEVAPFMLLDSLEAIDSDRIARLVSYFEGYASYLVVALLDEDAQALSEEYRRITEI